MSTLVSGISSLVTNDPAVGRGPLGVVMDAAVVFDDGKVAWVGPAGKAPDADEFHDAEGRAALPGFVDSHAHLVFAGDRTAEFAARMSGTPYSATPNSGVGVREPASSGSRGARTVAWVAEADRGGGSAGDHRHRVQVGIRPDGRGRGTLAADRERVHR